MTNTPTTKVVAIVTGKVTAALTHTAVSVAPITVISKRIITVEDRNQSLQKFKADQL